MGDDNAEVRRACEVELTGEKASGGDGADAYYAFREVEANPSEVTLMMAREAIQESGLPSAVIARDAHVNRSTLDSWIPGVRASRANGLQDLAAGLDRRPEHLQELEERLRRWRRSSSKRAASVLGAQR